MKNFDDVRREEIEENSAILYQQRRELNHQYNTTLNPDDKIKIKSKLDKNAEEIRDLEEQLENIRGGLNSLEEKLLEFDFKDTVETFEKIIRTFGKQGGAALFLLQNSPSKGRCIARLRELLEKGTGGNKFDYRSINLAYNIKNEYALLKKLTNEFDVKSNPIDIERCTQDVINKIKNSVPLSSSGRIIFIELTECDFFLQEKQVIIWLLQKFWVPLIKDLPEIANKHPYLKIVLLMVTENEIEKDFEQRNFCNPINFSSEKIINLPLNKCELSEIEKFLLLKFELHPNEAEELAQSVYKISKGNPNVVYEKLMKYLSEYYLQKN